MNTFAAIVAFSAVFSAAFANPIDPCPMPLPVDPCLTGGILTSAGNNWLSSGISALPATNWISSGISALPAAAAWGSSGIATLPAANWGSAGIATLPAANLISSGISAAGWPCPEGFGWNQGALVQSAPLEWSTGAVQLASPQVISKNLC